MIQVIVGFFTHDSAAEALGFKSTILVNYKKLHYCETGNIFHPTQPDLQEGCGNFCI